VEEARPARARGRGTGATRERGEGGERAVAGLGHRVAPVLDGLLGPRTDDAILVDRLEVAPSLVEGEPQGGVELVAFSQRVGHGLILSDPSPHGRGHHG
jgi:hypothetical protein